MLTSLLGLLLRVERLLVLVFSQVFKYQLLLLRSGHVDILEKFMFRGLFDAVFSRRF